MPIQTVALAVDEKEKAIKSRAGGGLYGPEKPGWSVADMIM